jgi:hypothetical protein
MLRSKASQDAASGGLVFRIRLSFQTESRVSLRGTHSASSPS